MSELKPCPFCGDIPKPKPSKDECWWHECGCKTVIINYEEWNTRPIEDALRVELARRDEELALTEKKLCNIDRSARAEVARRDEIITRLKEDAERLADGMIISPENEGDFCSYCGGMEHVDDCPITLHRALMKEVEND